MFDVSKKKETKNNRTLKQRIYFRRLCFSVFNLQQSWGLDLLEQIEGLIIPTCDLILVPDKLWIKDLAWYCSPALLSFFVKILIPKNWENLVYSSVPQAKPRVITALMTVFPKLKKTYSGRKFKMDLLWQYRTIKPQCIAMYVKEFFQLGSTS